MAISNALTTAAKVAFMNGELDFSSGTTQVFRIALYTDSATLDASTTSYSSSDEVSGAGYTAGGKVLVISTNPTSSGTTAYMDFADVTWTAASFTARGALIYLDDGGITDLAIATLDFGEDKSVTAGDFTVQFPVADAANAIIRIA